MTQAKSSNHKHFKHDYSKHSHGGQLNQASEHYGIPLDDWLDLSTGINPFTYPLPKLPDECWQRLPESNDGLETAAAKYYGSEYLLAVSGSQEAIQRLPLLFASPCNIGIVTPAYHSHQQAWESAGHNIVLLSPEDIEKPLYSLDILLIVNPTNPNAQTYKRDDLLKWHKQLVSQHGTLIIDEAFIDCTPEQSLIEKTSQPGLIVLRSIGKFFGLAGIRLGFVWAEEKVLRSLSNVQDDWSVSHPARWIGKTALVDFSWQEQQRIVLDGLSLRLKEVLENFLIDQSTHSKGDSTKKRPISGGVTFNTNLRSINNTVRHTSLFAFFEHTNAPLIHEALAKKGILTRLFSQQTHSITNDAEMTKNALRFGLPANEKQWLRLQDALHQISKNL